MVRVRVCTRRSDRHRRLRFAAGGHLYCLLSPLQYQSYDCNQLQLEAQRVSDRVSSLQGDLSERADNDSAKMGVGLVLFWPTLFFLHGDGTQATEYAHLKGERDAIEKASIERKCGFHMPEPAKPQPTTAKLPDTEVNE